jgi:hypothetical protein
MELDERDILDGMRSWTGAQRAFESVGDPGSPVRTVEAGWYGTDVDEHEGAFCMVKSGSLLEPLIGEVVEMRANQRRWVLYCIGASSSLPTDFALSRPAFLRFAALSDETVRATVRKTAR